MLECQSAKTFFFVADDHEPGALPVDLFDVLFGVLTRPEDPEAGFLCEFCGAGEVAFDAKGNVFEAAAGDVEDGGIERGGAFAGEDDALDAVEGGGAEDGTDVMQIGQLIEGEPESRGGSFSGQDAIESNTAETFDASV